MSIFIHTYNAYVLHVHIFIHANIYISCMYTINTYRYRYWYLIHDTNIIMHCTCIRLITRFFSPEARVEVSSSTNGAVAVNTSPAQHDSFLALCGDANDQPQDVCGKFSANRSVFVTAGPESCYRIDKTITRLVLVQVNYCNENM